MYQDIVVEERLKKVPISTILTPSDEAFFSLCIKIYFNKYTNLELEGYDQLIKDVSKFGWTAEGIELYDTLYHRVVRNCETFGEAFDVIFANLLVDLIYQKPNKRHKTMEELILIGCNNL